MSVISEMHVLCLSGNMQCTVGQCVGKYTGNEHTLFKNNVIFLCVLDITGMPTSVVPSKLCTSNTSDLLKPDVVIHKINFITSQVYFPI